MNKLKLTICLATLCCIMQANAQRHFYHKIDIGSSNIYTFVVSNLITGYANYFCHNTIFDNSYVYTLYSGELNGEKIKTKGLNPIGITAEEIFNDAFGGLMLGYQSDRIGTFNWGLYASAHYRIQQMEALFPDTKNYSHERFQYVKPGVGFFLRFGSIENPIKVQLEALTKYDFPIGYNGIFGTKAEEVLNKGVSSHFAVKVGGHTWFNVGIFADFAFYDLYKGMNNASHFKPYSFGVTFIITPKRGEDIL